MSGPVILGNIMSDLLSLGSNPLPDVKNKIWDVLFISIRIMPKAVCASHKSGVERNVLGRLLTLTYIYFRKVLSMTGYLRGEVRLPGNLFPTARPRVSITLNIYLENWSLFLFLTSLRTRHYMIHHEVHLHEITFRSMAINTCTVDEASEGEKERHDTTSTPRRGSLVRPANVSPACSRTLRRGARRRFVDRLSTILPVRRAWPR